MIDRLFIAVLSFSILAGATLAFGSELFASTSQGGAATARVATVGEVRNITLERVVVTAKRAPAPTHVAATEIAWLRAQ